MTENITELPLPIKVTIEEIDSPVLCERISLKGARKNSSFLHTGKQNTRIDSFRSDSLLCDKLDNLENELVSNNSILQQQDQLVKPGGSLGSSLRDFRSPNDISPGLAVITKGLQCNSVTPLTPLDMDQDLKCSQFKEIDSDGESEAESSTVQRVSILEPLTKSEGNSPAIGSSMSTHSNKLSSGVFSMASSLKHKNIQSEVVSNHNRAISINSAASAKSLNEEGFTKKNETENEVMWRMVETIRNKSSNLRENKRQIVTAPNANFGVSIHMDIIEEDYQEQFGTDFKKKGGDLNLSFFEKVRASKAEPPDIAPHCQGLFRDLKYYDLDTHADPPSRSEPASAMMRDERGEINSPGSALRRLSGLNIENLRLASGLSMAKDAIIAN